PAVPSTAVPSPMSDPALKQAINDYFLKEVKTESDTCNKVEDGDYEALNHDLDRDGENEFIVSIDRFCNFPQRAGSGGLGQDVIIEEEGAKSVRQGCVSRNSYGAAHQRPVNGRAVIYTTETMNRILIHEWHWNPKTSTSEEADDDSLT